MNEDLEKELLTKELYSIINDYNFYMSASGKLKWYYQAKIDSKGNREWVRINKTTLKANFKFIAANMQLFQELLVEQQRTFIKVSKIDNNGSGVLNVSMNKTMYKGEVK